MLLVCLLRRAAEGAPEAGGLTLRVQTAAAGLLLDVEEEGPGLGEALPGAAFHPLDLLACGGPGLDLLVAMGVARAQGWRLSWLRVDGRTVFRLSLPASDCVSLPERRAA
jgi:nitrogen-specific signal transduction histidine kinase